jgi:hypothetical protein
MTRTNLICLSVTMALTLAASPGCGDSGTAETNGSETGDGDGDTGDGDGDTGDGDGDGDTGDGDGDGDTGDGDGDTGDGDGDTGDGDGDTGDGDGDGDTGDGDGDGDLSFEADVYPIISANCSCHVLGAPAMLAMPDAATAHMNLVSMPSTEDPNLNRVEPSDALNSYIYQKITATQAGLGVGNVQMPNTGTTMSLSPLSAQDMMTFQAWIDAGAAP